MENWCVCQAYTGFVLGMPTLERPMISSFLGVDFANRFFKMAKKVHMYGPKHSVQSNKTTTAYCSHTFGIWSSNVWGLGYVLVFGMPTLGWIESTFDLLKKSQSLRWDHACCACHLFSRLDLTWSFLYERAQTRSEYNKITLILVTINPMVETLENFHTVLTLNS